MANMKVLALVLVTLGTVWSKGSGPYLPRGWKPDGPSFFLPSEVQKLQDNPLKDTIFQESEASGSDFLREYGPPKAVEDITNQYLPNVETNQVFVEVSAKLNEEEVTAPESVTIEVVTEKDKAEFVSLEETTSEAQAELETAVEDVTTESPVTIQEVEIETKSQPLIEGKSVGVDIEAEVEGSSQDTVRANIEESESIETTTDAVQQTADNRDEAEKVELTNIEVKTAQGNVNNIEEVLANLETDAITERVQTIQDVKEEKTLEESFGSLQQVPEGFLEYGPPGFTEYGPPKEDEILRSEAVFEENAVNIDTNDARKKRFSPKFRLTKGHKIL